MRPKLEKFFQSKILDWVGLAFIVLLITIYSILFAGLTDRDGLFVNFEEFFSGAFSNLRLLAIYTAILYILGFFFGAKNKKRIIILLVIGLLYLFPLYFLLLYDWSILNNI